MRIWLLLKKIQLFPLFTKLTPCWLWINALKHFPSPSHSFLFVVRSLSLLISLPGVRRMTERITRDMTARITTMAIPMPFQLRGGPSELPRSWFWRDHKTHNTQWWTQTGLRGEDISTASFPQSHISQKDLANISYQYSRLSLRGVGPVVAELQ